MTIRTTSLSILAVALLAAGILSCDNQAKSASTVSEAQATDVTNEQPAPAAATPESQQPAVAAQPTATIPDFTFYVLKSGIQFTKADLAKTGNLVFILFDPTCSHCQHEATLLGQHYDKLKDVHFYFVSMNDPALMSAFLQTHAKPLVGKANVEMLYDRNADFINKFHIPSQYPAVYVYGDDHQLKEYWDGERDINEVIAAIRK